MKPKPNNLDPQVTQEQLVFTLFGDLPLAHERIVTCVHKRYLSKLDLLYLEEKIRKLHCAIVGLLHSVDHDKPLLLPNIDNDKTATGS